MNQYCNELTLFKEYFCNEAEHEAVAIDDMKEPLIEAVLSEVLQIIVDEYVNEFASNLSVDVFYKDLTEQILMFDGTVIIDFYLSYNEYQNEYQKIETITPDLNRAGIVIQDLTFNALFKFNFSRETLNKSIL